MNVTDGGAYLLHLRIISTVHIAVGALGDLCFTPGRYVYVGSARRNIAARVARHRRLAKDKSGKLHWHIDYLLVHPCARLVTVSALRDADECHLSQRIARRKGSSAAVPGFGASDCRSGCRTHLYRID